MKKYLIILCGLLLASVTGIQAQCYTLAWSDEFDGTELDRSKWNVEIGDGYPELFGWGNNESQYYTDRPENIEISNGSLKIIARNETFGSRNYTSARIRSQGNFDFKYGRIESRIKIPSGQGTWPAFWLLPTDKVFGGWPASGEIDIMENFGQDNFMSSTIHYDNASNDWQFNTQTYGVNRDEFHIFSAVWQEDRIDFFIDWNWIGSETPDDVSGNWPFNEDFHFLLNMALGGSAGSINTTFPKTMEVDYVRVYQLVQDIQIQGPDLIFENETVQYSLPSNTSASYDWSAPSGASIISGQGTNEVTVSWSTSNGTVSCSVEDWNGDIDGVNSNCGDGIHTLDVTVESGNCDVVMLDFDKAQELIPSERTTGINGIETMFFNNPETDNVNSSGFVGRFGRTGAQTYDVLKLDFVNPIDAGTLYNGSNIFKMDLLKELSGNIDVTVEFVNRALNTGYPNGIHSQYTGTISSTDSWETVSFTFTNRADWTISDEMVDGVNILFNPNTNTADKYYFDNLRTTLPVMGEITGTSEITGPGSNTFNYTAPLFVGANYNWTASGASIVSGGTDQIVELEFNNNGTSTLSVDITNSMNCSYNYDVEVTGVVGLDKDPFEGQVSVSPNPFNRTLRVINEMNETMNYNLTSVEGISLETGTLSNSIEISTENFNNGIYFLRVEKNHQMITFKVVKN